MGIDSSAGKIPVFQEIKAHVLAQIQTGIWRDGDLIPGETALARQFGVSRMTVNRAMAELSHEQVIERVQGSGTFVAQRKYQTTLVAIRDIPDEIAARGHRHRSELQLLERTNADDTLARRFHLRRGTLLFHSVIVHFEDELPIQVEDRHVNPEIAPGYMEQDFNNRTPSAYLMHVAPLQGVGFIIEACPVPLRVRQLLSIPESEYALVLRRRTHSKDQVASVVDLWHPSSRYRFTGHF